MKIFAALGLISLAYGDKNSDTARPAPEDMIEHAIINPKLTEKEIFKMLNDLTTSQLDMLAGYEDSLFAPKIPLKTATRTAKLTEIFIPPFTGGTALKEKKAAVDDANSSKLSKKNPSKKAGKVEADAFDEAIKGITTASAFQDFMGKRLQLMQGLTSVCNFEVSRKRRVVKIRVEFHDQ